MATRKLNGRMVDEVLVPLGYSVPTSGRCFHASVTSARPANQTPYSSGDVIGDDDSDVAIQLPLMGPPGGAVTVQTAWLFLHTGTVPTSMTTGVRMHLYTAAPQALADNAAWDLVAADRAAYAGFADLGAPVDFGSTVALWSGAVDRVIKLPAGATTLWAHLVTTSAATFAENSTGFELRVTTADRG